MKSFSKEQEDDDKVDPPRYFDDITTPPPPIPRAPKFGSGCSQWELDDQDGFVEFSFISFVKDRMKDHFLTTWMRTVGILSDTDGEQNVRISIIAFNSKMSKSRDPKSTQRKTIQLAVNATKKCLDSVFDESTNVDSRALHDAVRNQYCVAIVVSQGPCQKQNKKRFYSVLQSKNAGGRKNGGPDWIAPHVIGAITWLQEPREPYMLITYLGLSKQKPPPATCFGDSWHGKGLGRVLLLAALRNAVYRIQGGIDAYVQCDASSRASLFYITLGFQQLSFPNDVDAGKSRLPASLRHFVIDGVKEADPVHWYSGEGCDQICLYSLKWGTLNPPRLTKGDAATLFGETDQAITSFEMNHQMYAIFPFGNISHRAVEQTSHELVIMRRLGLPILHHLGPDSDEDIEFTKRIFPQFRKHFIQGGITKRRRSEFNDKTWFELWEIHMLIAWLLRSREYDSMVHFVDLDACSYSRDLAQELRKEKGDRDNRLMESSVKRLQVYFDRHPTMFHKQFIIFYVNMSGHWYQYVIVNPYHIDTPLEDRTHVVGWLCIDSLKKKNNGEGKMLAESGCRLFLNMAYSFAHYHHTLPLKKSDDGNSVADSEPLTSDDILEVSNGHDALRLLNVFGPSDSEGNFESHFINLKLPGKEAFLTQQDGHNCGLAAILNSAIFPLCLSKNDTHKFLVEEVDNNGFLNDSYDITNEFQKLFPEIMRENLLHTLRYEFLRWADQIADLVQCQEYLDSAKAEDSFKLSMGHVLDAITAFYSDEIPEREIESSEKKGPTNLPQVPPKKESASDLPIALLEKSKKASNKEASQSTTEGERILQNPRTKKTGRDLPISQKKEQAIPPAKKEFFSKTCAMKVPNHEFFCSLQDDADLGVSCSMCRRGMHEECAIDLRYIELDSKSTEPDSNQYYCYKCFDKEKLQVKAGEEVVSMLIREMIDVDRDEMEEKNERKAVLEELRKENSISLEEFLDNSFLAFHKKTYGQLKHEYTRQFDRARQYMASDEKEKKAMGRKIMGEAVMKKVTANNQRRFYEKEYYVSANALIKAAKYDVRKHYFSAKVIFQSTVSKDSLKEEIIPVHGGWMVENFGLNRVLAIKNHASVNLLSLLEGTQQDIKEVHFVSSAAGIAADAATKDTPGHFVVKTTDGKEISVPPDKPDLEIALRNWYFEDHTRNEGYVEVPSSIKNQFRMTDLPYHGVRYVPSRKKRKKPEKSGKTIHDVEDEGRRKILRGRVKQEDEEDEYVLIEEKWLAISGDKDDPITQEISKEEATKLLGSSLVQHAQRQSQKQYLCFPVSRFCPPILQEDSPLWREDAPTIRYQQDEKDTCVYSSFCSALFYAGFQEEADWIMSKSLEDLAFDDRFERLRQRTCEVRLQWLNPDKKVYGRGFDFIKSLGNNAILTVSLEGSDMQSNHAVSVYRGWIFDSCEKRALPVERGSLDLCVKTKLSDDVTFVQFGKGILFKEQVKQCKNASILEKKFQKIHGCDEKLTSK